MNKLIKTLVAMVLLAALLLGEYRVIMANIEPYHADGYAHADIFGEAHRY